MLVLYVFNNWLRFWVWYDICLIIGLFIIYFIELDNMKVLLNFIWDKFLFKFFFILISEFWIIFDFDVRLLFKIKILCFELLIIK